MLDYELQPLNPPQAKSELYIEIFNMIDRVVET